MTTGPIRRDVATTDALQLATWSQGDPARPTVLLVHGYPDDHHVWDGVAERLAGRYRVVTFDVRGAGVSQAPASRSGYRMEQLAADVAAVAADYSDEPVHLVGHDWGSIQSWPTITDPAYAPGFASFSSISGPDLEMASAWLRGARRHPLAALRQGVSSGYIPFFCTPWLPERLIDLGALGRLTGRPVETATARNGLELYRANMLGGALERLADAVRGGSANTPRGTDLPVQVLAPTGDRYVGVPLQTEAPAPYCSELHTQRIPGGHWVVAEDADLIAGLIDSFIGD